MASDGSSPRTYPPDAPLTEQELAEIQPGTVHTLTWRLAAEVRRDRQALRTTLLNLRTLRFTKPGVRTYDKWIEMVERTLDEKG